jgi:hypothetical protein
VVTLTGAVDNDGLPGRKALPTRSSISRAVKQVVAKLVSENGAN